MPAILAHPAPPPPAGGAAGLPPPVTEPIGVEVARLMWAMEHAPRLAAVLESEAIFFAHATGTRVDTGWWFVGGRVWAITTGDSLLLYAPGPRPLFDTLAFHKLRGSLYNHIVGGVALGPLEDEEAAFARTLRHSHQAVAPSNSPAATTPRLLRMPPAEGYQLLSQIQHGHTKGDTRSAPLRG